MSRDSSLTRSARAHDTPTGCPHLAALSARVDHILPAFPPERENPLNPPPVYAELRSSAALGKARLWDGKEAWLITRYDDVRAVLGDPRFSSDIRLSGYPTVSAAMKVASCSRKKLSQSQDIASAPPSITFISRPEWASPWNCGGRWSTWPK